MGQGNRIMWNKWSEQQPESGQKIIIVCSDGCSSASAYVVDGENEGIEVLHSEDMWVIGDDFLDGSLWSELPSDYPIHFMEITEDG